VENVKSVISYTISGDELDSHAGVRVRRAKEAKRARKCSYLLRAVTVALVTVRYTRGWTETPTHLCAVIQTVHACEPVSMAPTAKETAVAY